MDFVKHPNHTRFIGKPANWDESRDGRCEALSVFDRCDETSGFPVMESAWVPTPQEAVAMATGYAQIRLGVLGTSHPVIYMGTAAAVPTDREEYLAKLKAAAQWLYDLAKAGKVDITMSPEGVGLIDKWED